MPFNLTWQQRGGITIQKIPCNTCKDFNFGDILKPKSEPEQFASYPSPSSIEFKFVDVDKKVNLKSGEHKIRIEFSANNVKPQIKIYKLDIKNKWVDDVNNIKEMLLIEEED